MTPAANASCKITKPATRSRKGNVAVAKPCGRPVGRCHGARRQMRWIARQLHLLCAWGAEPVVSRRVAAALCPCVWPARDSQNH